MEKQTHYMAVRKFSNPTIEDIQQGLERVKEDDIKEYYDSYEHGCLVSYVLHELPRLDIVHSSDINVCYSNSNVCKCHTEITVERYSREWARNYMGYHRGERCYVFAGQRRLIEEFLEITASLFKRNLVETAYVQPRPHNIPIEGLNPGLNYEQFAAYIENWDCILFLPPGTDDPLWIDNTASQQKVSPQEMYAPASYGLLVEAPSAEQRQIPRTLVRVPNNAGPAATDTITNLPTRQETSRYALRQRKLSISYK